MNNFHGRMMNIRDGADGADSIEYKRGHRDARHAAAEIANEADNRIAELEAQLAAARAELTRLWLIAYNGEYIKARNWGADHQQADTYARRAAGDVRVAGEKI